jgi:hypothetical protein
MISGVVDSNKRPHRSKPQSNNMGVGVEMEFKRCKIDKELQKMMHL